MRILLLLALASAPVVAAPAGAEAQSQTQGAATYRVGDAVSIQWSASWWPGRIMAVDGDRYQVRYDGYDASWDEWVTAARLRRPDAAAPATPARPAAPAAPTSPVAPTTPAAAGTGVHGTWQYQSWTTRRRGEVLDRNVFYWLTLRPNGSWLLSNTTRSSPNTSETVAWGTYTLQRGELVLTQGGRPARTYGRYTLRQNGTGEMTLREGTTGDVIVLRRGRS